VFQLWHTPVPMIAADQAEQQGDAAALTGHALIPPGKAGGPEQQHDQDKDDEGHRELVVGARNCTSPSGASASGST
jgi:hypothetical protein